MLILLLLLVNVGCSADRNNIKDQASVIKIGYLPITHAAPLFVQKQQLEQSHPEYNIELIKFGTWPDLMDALNTGRIDGASVLIQLAMKAMEKGIDLSAVALGHEDGNVLIADREIETIQEMKDQSIAIPHIYSTQHLLVAELLRLEDMEYDDIDIVELPPAEMPVALSEGRISGYVVAEPFGALGVKLGIGDVLTSSEELWPNSYCCVLVLRDDFITSNMELSETFVTDYVKAGVRANEKDDRLYNALLEYVKVEESTLDLSLEWITFDDLYMEKEAYNDIYHQVLELNLMQTPPTYDEFVNRALMDRTKIR